MTRTAKEQEDATVAYFMRLRGETMMEHFERRVNKHTTELDQRTKDTALVWDLWNALKEVYATKEANHG